MRDEIIAEVRRNRDELAAKFNYDVRKIFEAIKKREAETGRTYI